MAKKVTTPPPDEVGPPRMIDREYWPFLADLQARVKALEKLRAGDLAFAVQLRQELDALKAKEVAT